MMRGWKIWIVDELSVPTKIIQNVTGTQGENDILHKMRDQEFAVLIDELTDITSDKNLAIVIRTLDGSKYIEFTSRDEFLILLPVTDCTASAMVKYFEEKRVPYKEKRSHLQLIMRMLRLGEKTQ